jgi:hypothetical protein
MVHGEYFVNRQLFKMANRAPVLAQDETHILFAAEV